MIGPPRDPVSAEMIDRVADVISTAPGICEAHLPMVYAQGVTPIPELVLVLVCASGVEPQSVMASVGEGLKSRDAGLTVWPMELDDEFLPAVREANMRVWP